MHFRELTDLPEGYEEAGGQDEAMGNGPGDLCAKQVIHEPFIVINADDYYGKKDLRKIPRSI